MLYTILLEVKGEQDHIALGARLGSKDIFQHSTTDGPKKSYIGQSMREELFLPLLPSLAD